MSEHALKCESHAIFKQNYTQKLLMAFKMAYFCCFCLIGNLDFPDFVQRGFYDINVWYHISLWRFIQDSFHLIQFLMENYLTSLGIEPERRLMRIAFHCPANQPPGTCAKNILKHKRHATLFLKHFDWLKFVNNQSKGLKNR